MLEAEARMHEVLASHTLADLAARMDAKAPPGFGEAVANWLSGEAPGRVREKFAEPVGGRTAER
jgi:hypothetical protein